jgi:ABC-type dipeptide/oligopeptide/nickel transport system permease component
VVLYRYILRRLAFGALTVFGVSVIIFVVMRILPGDPLVAVFGMEGFTKLTPEQRAHYMAELGLSDPLPVQYVRWLGDIARGKLGKSFFRDESVADLIIRRGPLSAEIGILSVLLSWMMGLPVGILSAIRPNSFTDMGARFLSILFLAVPSRRSSGLATKPRWSGCRCGSIPGPTCN